MTARRIDVDFETVVDCKEVFEKHRCFDKGWTGAGSAPVGRIICCKECGKHWYVVAQWGDSQHVWRRVRWYHYKMRRAIVGK